MGGRAMLPLFGRGLRPAIVLFGCGLMCWAVSALMGVGVTPLTQGNPWPARLAVLAVAAGALFWAGQRLAARMRVAWADWRRLGRNGPAIVAAVCVMSVAVPATLIQQTRLGPRGVAALLLWAASLIVLAIAATAGMRGLLTAVLGTLAVLDLTVIVAALPWAQAAGIDLGSAPLWFPVTQLDMTNSGLGFGPARTCLLTSAFVLGYAHATRGTSACPMPFSASALIQAAATATLALRGWLIACCGLAVWVYALTSLTAALNPQNDGGGQHHIWAHEIRQAAILVMIAGLALAINTRGTIIFPVILAFVALWSIDAVIDSLGASGPRAAIWAACLGVIVLSTASQLAQAIGADPASARRSLAGVAVLAAFCVPAVAMDAILYTYSNNSAANLPDGYAMASAAVVGMLSFCALACAHAVRGGTHWIDSAMIATVIGSTSTLLPAVPIILGLGTPLAALTAWYLRPPDSAARWSIILPAALVAGIPMGYLQVTAGGILGAPIMAMAGYPRPQDALPILPGAILCGAIVAAIATMSRKASRPNEA